MMGTWYVLTWHRSPWQWCQKPFLLPLEHALVWFSLEEERVMEQSSVSISLSFENQGINPVGGYARVPRTYTKQINPRNQRDKGLSIPTGSLTRVRSDRYDRIICLVFL